MTEFRLREGSILTRHAQPPPSPRDRSQRGNDGISRSLTIIRLADEEQGEAAENEEENQGNVSVPCARPK